MNECTTCGKQTENLSYCSRSCAASRNNKLHPKRQHATRDCIECTTSFRVPPSKNQQYCSIDCRRASNLKQLHGLLVENSVISGQKIKGRLLRAGLLNPRCYECGLTEWLGQPAPLVMDHINGKNRDHRLENLRMLCGNCNMLQPTFCWGNTKDRRAKRGLID